MVNEMGLNNINSLTLPIKIANMLEGITFRVGEILALSIINLQDDGQAEVSVGNQRYLARFENGAKAGESVKATISEVNEDSITLIRPNQDKIILEKGILVSSPKNDRSNQTKGERSTSDVQNSFNINQKLNNVSRETLNSINIKSANLGQTITLEVGQKVTINVIRMQNNGEAEISIGNQKILANVEANVKSGDSFPAYVKQIDAEGVVLVRLIQDKVALNRGIILNDEVKTLIENFRGMDNKTIPMQNIQDLNKMTKNANEIINSLFEAIPEWKDISANTIMQYFKNLGLEHENKLAEKQAYTQELGESDLKGKIMEILFGHKNIPTAEKSVLENILNQITGQQIWLQSGTDENAFLLMNIPCRENSEVYEARVVIEGQRKGNKIDHKHMRIGLLVDTEFLGSVGADIVVYDSSLELSILHDNPELIDGLIKETFTESILRFSNIGFDLKAVNVKKLTPNVKFSKFLVGESTGVDLFG